MRTFLLAATTLLVLSSPAAASAPLPRTFTVRVAPCPTDDALECTDRADATIYVSPQADQFALWHGIGHLYDEQRLTPGDRNWFTRSLNLQGHPWRSGTGLNGLHSPSERFADAYAACALGLDPDGAWETAYDYLPSSRHHTAICRAIRRVAARHG